MKIQKENVQIDPGKSFRLFEPRLRNYFYWHHHPEYELVYVEAINGIRHVGQHISSYLGSELLFIGPNVPHLNFDYGIETDYKQTVIQLKENFLGDAFLEAPEFSMLKNLFSRAYLGLSFTGDTKVHVLEKLKLMPALNNFQQLLCLIEILELLAGSSEVTELNDQDTSIRLFLNDKIRMGSIYNYIHANFNQHPDVNTIAAEVNLSTAAFCRYFKRQTKMTFTEFVNQYRITQAKTLLLQDKSISEVCYEVGFESLSYFNKLFKKETGENPSVFKKLHLYSA